MNIKVDMCFETTTGCKWLVSPIEADNIADLMEAAKNYYIANYRAAERLVKKWRENDEDVDIYVSFELKACDYKKTEIMRSLCNLLDQLENERF